MRDKTASFVAWAGRCISALLLIGGVFVLAMEPPGEEVFGWLIVALSPWPEIAGRALRRVLRP